MGDVIFYPSTWIAFKWSKPIRNRITNSRLSYMSAFAPAFTPERYKIKKSANIRDLVFREFAEYNTNTYIYKNMIFLNETFFDYYIKLRACPRASSLNICVVRAEWEATLTRKSQSRANNDDINWRAPSLDNSKETNLIDKEDENDELKK